MYEDLIDFARKSSIICHLKCSYISGALSCARRAQRSTMGKKIKFSTHPRKFGYDISVLRPSVRTPFGGKRRESGFTLLKDS